MTEQDPHLQGDERPPARRIAAFILALIVGLTITVAVVDPDGPDGSTPPRVEVTVTKVDVSGDGVRDAPIIVPAAAAEALEDSLPKSELADPLREPGDTGPVGVPEGPLAADEVPGCRTRFVGNYSSRGGVKPRVIVLHQTVSRERGWASQNALTAFANRRSSGVSWHLLIAPTLGHCTYTVPLSMKAWTQGNANPFSIGIEVERFGDEPTYVEGAGRARLVAVLRHIGRRFDIPMRKGLVVNCRVVRAGIIEHSDLGRCGGAHADVTPWSTSPIIAEAAKSNSSASRARASTCNKLRYQRAKMRRNRPGTTENKAAVKRIKELRSIAARQGLDHSTCR